MPDPAIGRLTRPGPPHIHILAATPSDAHDLGRKVETSADEPGPKPVARFVRGDRCGTEPALMDEFAAAWQFPPYFGRNWDALDECLSDLSWLPGPAHVLIVSDADTVLAHAGPAAIDKFLAVLGAVARDRPAFQVVLQVKPGHETALADRLTAAKVAFDHLHR